MRLELAKIKVDETIYPRSGVSEFNVGRLVAALMTGAKLPPLTVEAKTFRLVDGRHRLAAYAKVEVEKAEVTTKVYATEADLFADAVRLNVGHGEPLDNFSVHNAIIRLEAYGWTRERVSEVVRLPVSRIEKIERGFAHTPEGEPLALKGGLSHLHGQTLTDQQQQTNRHYSGPKATFHLKQLRELLERDMWPQTAMFRAEMDRLVEVWARVNKSEAA